MRTELANEMRNMGFNDEKDITGLTEWFLESRGNADVYLRVASHLHLPSYVGISKEAIRRYSMDRDYELKVITPTSLSTQPGKVVLQPKLLRNQARAIEEALICRNWTRENKSNSIAGENENHTNHSFYNLAVKWGEMWLRTNGFFELLRPIPKAYPNK